MTIGFRVKLDRPRPNPELVEAFSRIPVANVSDNMSRMFAGAPALRPLDPKMRLAGVALTVRTRPGDNLMIHKAIDMAGEGDVIVVDAGGDLTNSLVGEIMLRLSERRKIAGWVIDGAVRDFDALSRGIPVFARGVTHRGPYKDGPGEINYAVSVGGMLVNAGDIIIGDCDGVLAIPPEGREELLRNAQAQQAREADILRQIAEGTVDRSWIDAALKAKGCTFE